MSFWSVKTADRPGALSSTSPRKPSAIFQCLFFWMFFVAMCYPGTQLLTNYLELMSWFMQVRMTLLCHRTLNFQKQLPPLPPHPPLITYNDAYNINIFEIGRASRDCGFHKFWGCKFLGLWCKVRWPTFSQNALTIFQPVIKFHWILLTAPG